jgi:hypothetical protein
MHTCIVHLDTNVNATGTQEVHGAALSVPKLEIIGRVCNIMIVPTALICKYLRCGSSTSHRTSSNAHDWIQDAKYTGPEGTSHCLHAPRLV